MPSASGVGANAGCGKDTQIAGVEGIVVGFCPRVEVIFPDGPNEAPDLRRACTTEEALISARFDDAAVGVIAVYRAREAAIGDDGVVQHGSSGATIFNQNKRVVGQLKGNDFYNPFN